MRRSSERSWQQAQMLKMTCQAVVWIPSLSQNPHGRWVLCPSSEAHVCTFREVLGQPTTWTHRPVRLQMMLLGILWLPHCTKRWPHPVVPWNLLSKHKGIMGGSCVPVCLRFSKEVGVVLSILLKAAGMGKRSRGSAV